MLALVIASTGTRTASTSTQNRFGSIQENFTTGDFLIKQDGNQYCSNTRLLV
jgi:hypothetical protein